MSDTTSPSSQAPPPPLPGPYGGSPPAATADRLPPGPPLTETQRAALVGPEGALAFHTVCAGCAYNLQGLTPDGRCPECGLAVAASLHGGLLRLADPGYVRTLASGVALTLWYYLLVVLVTMLAVVLAFVGAVAIRYLGLPGLLVGVLYLIAVWRITAAETGDGPASGTAPRFGRAVRVLTAVSLVFGAASAALTAAYGVNMAAVERISAWFQVPVNGIGIVLQFLLMALFAGLARRLPDMRLARTTRGLRWALLVGLTLIWIINVYAVIALYVELSEHAEFVAQIVVGLIGGVGGLVVLVCTIWWVVLLFRYRGAFKREAQWAEYLRQRMGEQAP